MSLSEELEKLNKLKESGALSETEFEKAKATLLREQDSPGEKLSKMVTGVSEDVNLWSMFIHLSQLVGFLAPVVGLVIPVILWQVKKDTSPIIDRHGRIVTNWIISALIYGAVSVVLTVVFIGFLFLIVLGVLWLVYAIVGGIKANNGEVWEYPLSIKFFPVD